MNVLEKKIGVKRVEERWLNCSSDGLTMGKGRQIEAQLDGE